MLMNLTPLIMLSRLRKYSPPVNVVFVPICLHTIVMITIGLDAYIFSTLMRDLVSHDRKPAAFLIYLHLSAESARLGGHPIPASHQTMAELTGLSKSSVQKSIRWLVGRKLLKAAKASSTATPVYRVLHPWRR